MGGGIRKKTDIKEVAEDVSKASTIYQKVSAIDHVLLRPEMYIGSIENHYISKAWMMHSDAKPRILPKLLPAGPKFDASYKELHGSFVMDEDVKIESEGTESNADTEVISKVADNEIKGANNGDKVPNFDVIEGKIGGVDQKLCVAGEQNVEVIFGPGSLYQRDVWENPGLLKIVDEILVNAADNRLSTPTDGTTSQTFIKVLFDKETGRITVSNDGNGIPIVKHKDHNLWIPEMIFGHLLTSSHYENDPESVAAGRHGYGAKLTNIMSSEFTVTCHWKDKVFMGKWSDNMQKCDINVSSREYSNESFTEVSFVPEYDRFMVEDLKKRAKYEAELSKKRENDRLLQATKKKMVEMYGEKESKIAIKLLQKKKSDDIKNTLADGVIPADFNIRDELFCIVQKRCLDLAASIGSTQKSILTMCALRQESFQTTAVCTFQKRK